MKIIRSMFDKCIEAVSIGIFALMVLLVTFQVFVRYVLNSPSAFSETLTRYLFVWLVYFSVAYTAKKEAHIRIDAATNIYPKKARPYVEILSEIIVLAFAIFIAATSVTVFQKITASGQISPALHVPMQFVYAAPLVGFFLTAIRQIQCIIKKIKGLHNHEEVQEA